MHGNTGRSAVDLAYSQSKHPPREQSRRPSIEHSNRRPSTDHHVMFRADVQEHTTFERSYSTQSDTRGRSYSNHRMERADSGASLQSSFERSISGALPMSPLADRPDDMSHLMTVRAQELYIKSQRLVHGVYDDSEQLYYRAQAEAERQQQDSIRRASVGTAGSYNVEDDPLVQKMMAQVASAKAAFSGTRQSIDVPPGGIVGADKLRHNPSFSGCLAVASKREFPEPVEPLIQTFVPNSCAGRLVRPRQHTPGAYLPSSYSLLIIPFFCLSSSLCLSQLPSSTRIWCSCLLHRVIRLLPLLRV